MPVTKINPPALPDAAAMGYSQITTSAPGTLIQMSGQVAWSRDGAPVPADIAEQAKRAMDNVKAGLEAAGAGIGDITLARLYVVNLDPEKMAAAAAPLMEFFGGQAPCVTAIGVTSLAAPDLLIEIEVTAVI